MKRLALLCAALLCSQLTPAQARGTYRPPSGWPKGLAIPRLGVHASIEADPLITTKPLDQQPRWQDVLWVSRGAKPGDPGRAVIIGHLDTTCCPAVFWNLHQLRPGDLIYVYYRAGIVTFRVIWQHGYADAAVPYGWMYGRRPSDQRSLVLMTCAGTWHGPEAGYDLRLLVFARLILSDGHLG